MNVPDITEIKEHLESLKNSGLIEQWELPYENLLTRRSAAIFFVKPSSTEVSKKIWSELAKYDDFFFRENTEKTLSQLDYRITFNPEEKIQEQIS